MAYIEGYSVKDLLFYSEIQKAVIISLLASESWIVETTLMHIYTSKVSNQPMH